MKPRRAAHVLTAQDSTAREVTAREALRGLFRWLAAGPARLVVVNLEDLWLESRPQNVPGTGPERPNWRGKAGLPFETFARRPELLGLLRAISRLRES